jgi:hypothetical protein
MVKVHKFGINIWTWRRLGVLGAALLVCTLSYTQKPSKLRSLANDAALVGDWATAYAYLQSAYSLDSTSFDTRAEYALAAFELGDYEMAALLFQQNYNKDKGQLRPDALFYLAASQKRLGQYENAQRNFKSYLKKHKTKALPYLIERAENEFRSAQWALQYDTKDSTFSKCTILDSIQSPLSEYVSAFHRNSVFFNRVDSLGKWRIWRWSNGAMKVVPIEDLPYNADVANLTFVDSINVLFSLRIEDVTKIYSASWINEELENLTVVSELNTIGKINTMPCFGYYNQIPALYFVSDRNGGAGGLDIWYSLLEQNRWQKPMNAGAAVNSVGDEVTPSWHEDELYFASDYRYGFGGMDIFRVKAPNGIWQQAINLGDAINTPQHDVAFSLDHSGGAYMLSSSSSQSWCRENLSFGCLDVYRGKCNVKPPTKQQEETLFFASLKQLNEALPVTLYFHNDEPNPKTQDTISSLTYGEAYYAYLDLIPKYLQENSNHPNAEMSEERELMTQDFFDLQVKKGFADLDVFTALLLKELREGHSIRVWIRGFASPRAQSNYNLNLTKRRTSSLIKHIRELDNGVFLPYLEDNATSGARLEFVQLPFGEYKAKAGVSDDLLDAKNSIYGRAACLERKIEIESATIMPNTVKEPKLGAFEESHSFGKIAKWQPVKYDFYLPNEGNAPMIIDSIVPECGCTTPQMDIMKILPGEKGKLEVSFDPFGKKGISEKYVTIFIKGMEPKRIRIEAEIE